MADAPQALRQRPGFVLARLALLFRRRSAQKLAQLGLTMAQYAVLCCLAEYGASSQRDIAARTGIDASDLVPVLDTLQEEIRVLGDRDAADQRRADIRIADSGERLLSRASKHLDAVEDELLRALSAGERAQLCELATRVVS